MDPVPPGTESARDADRSAAIREVFDHWQATLGKPQAKLSPDRAKKIAARLREGATVEDCKQAIDGCAASPFHRGENDQGRAFDSIELIFRNREKLEKFMELAGASLGAASDATGVDPQGYDPAAHGPPRDPKNFAAWNRHQAAQERARA